MTGHTANESEQNANNKIRERILKLHKLVEQGIGGEKQNAQKILDKLLAKHGITLSEITDDDQEEEFIIKFKGAFEKRLLTQIIGKIINRKTFGCINRGKLHFYATKMEHVEILTLFSVYKNALSREFEDLFVAFIHQQDIFPPQKDDQAGTNDRPKTPEERSRIRKLASMMSTIDKVNVYEAIEVKHG